MGRTNQVVSLMVVITLSVAGVFLACGGGGGGGGGDDPCDGIGDGITSISSLTWYPSSIDSYEDYAEGASFDNIAATASSILIGESQDRTIFPISDVDYVAVALSAGTTYEFSVNQLATNNDSHMYLYSYDGVNTAQVGYNDDYIDLDSRIEYTPSRNDVFLIKVESLEHPIGLLAYTLSAHIFTDGDADGFSPFYDCDDSEFGGSIFPDAVEIPGDEIDQNCSGVDELLATEIDLVDSCQGDDSYDLSIPMEPADKSPWEYHQNNNVFLFNARTIHSAGQSDFFSVSIPANTAFSVEDILGWNKLRGTLYDSDGITILNQAAAFSYINSSDSEKTFFIKYEADNQTDTRYYVPFIYSLGTDMDGDTYSTQNWASMRDCDDTDAGVHPFATEITDDGIDQDCDGVIE